MIRAYLLFLYLLLPASAAADVVHQGDSGFEIRHSITVEAEPPVIHRTLTSSVSEWWVSSHTYSGDSANLYIEMETGGGFYENLPNGGFVEHLRLLYFSPGSVYRWEGALGPLQPMAVDGRFTWTVESTDSGNTITFTYVVWGNPPGGLASLAGPVDGMMKETITSLEQRLNWN